jgi:hypothetical protein
MINLSYLVQSDDCWGNSNDSISWTHVIMHILSDIIIVGEVAAILYAEDTADEQVEVAYWEHWDNQDTGDYKRDRSSQRYM